MPRRCIMRAGFGPRAAIEPVAAGGGAVVAQPGEAGQLLARLDGLIQSSGR